MSFDDWNLSSGEEEGFDDWTGGTQEQAESSPVARHSTNRSDASDTDGENPSRGKGHMTVAFFSEESENDQDGEEEIDWEDGHDGEQMAEAVRGNEKLAADNINEIQLKPVTLDWSESFSKKKKATNKRKRVARRSYRFEHLPWDLQRFLSNLQKSHLLCLTGHAIRSSEYCSEEGGVYLAHSLIPLAWMSDNHKKKQAPTEDDLANFCHFFFTLVRQPSTTGWYSRMSKQKKSLGKNNGNSGTVDAATIQYRIERYCAHLAAAMAGRQQRARRRNTSNFNCYDKLHLLLCMVRSLGWRARYVIAFDPPKKDLDANHPLFVAISTRNVFQMIWKEQGKHSSIKKAAKRAKLKNPKREAKSMSPIEVIDEKPTEKAVTPTFPEGSSTASENSMLPVCWVEILCHSKRGSEHKFHWVCVDPRLELVDQPASVERLLYSEKHQIPFNNVKKKIPISYALAAEHFPGSKKCRLTDVTPRYASSWVDSLKSRGVLRGKQTRVKDGERIDKWWTSVLKSVNAVGKTESRKEIQSKGKSANDAIILDDDNSAEGNNDKLKAVEDHEKRELHASAKDEPIPTSKSAFKSHPIYVIPSILNANEVLVPDAKSRFCGIFKGEMVFRRTDVEQALTEKRWLYRGRKVRRSELEYPVKSTKARKTSTKGFKALKSYGVGLSNDGGNEFKKMQLEAGEAALDDGMENIYASWQTDPWSPTPISANDAIPVNEHRNVELELLNPGLVHVTLHRVSKVAKQLGIPYAPCLLGFEGHGGNRTPNISGIVVHAHNEELLREAHVEMASQLLEEEHENHQKAVLTRWKRLLVGVLIKARLERDYGDG